MEAYLLSIFALLIACCSIRGKTWDNKSRGLIKLTSWGWGMLIMSLFIAYISISNTYDQKRIEKYNYFMANGVFFDVIYQEYKARKTRMDIDLDKYCPHYVHLHDVWETKMLGSAATSINYLVQACVTPNEIDDLTRMVMLTTSITTMCLQYEELSQKCDELKKEYGDTIKF
jgi:hypothetical protein